MIAGAFAALARWPHPLTFAVATILLGGRQLALAVAMHDAAHGSLFTGRWANEVLADVLCAAPTWNDVARYRRHHLGHHAHTGSERDPDLSLAPVEPMPRASFARKILRDLTGIAGLRRVVALLLRDFELISFGVGGRVERAPRQSILAHATAGARHLARPVLTNLALVAILALFGIAWTYLAWVVAYLTTFSLFLRIRSLAEHAGLERTSDSLRNTRTTRASLLARATVAPLHVNYHLEHHLLPTVPWFRLPALAHTLAERDVIPASSRAVGYLAMLARITR